MKYIKEYSIFNLFKKKVDKDNVDIPVVIAPKLIDFKDFDSEKINKVDKSGWINERIAFYSRSSHKNTKDIDIVKISNPKIGCIHTRSNITDYTCFYEGDDCRYLNVEYIFCIKEYIEDIYDQYKKSGLIIGVDVKFDDNKIGKIQGKIPFVFSDFSFSSSIRESKIYAGFIIFGSDDNIYYRVASQLSTVDTDLYTLPSKFEEEVRDYLIDIDESEKFNVVIEKVISEKFGIMSYILRISFKNGIKNNLDTVSLFFRNINTLKKRVEKINNYTLDIEDLDKKGITIKIYNENKKFESKEVKFCDRCGESCTIIIPSMYNNDMLCLDCKKLENDGKVTGDDLRDLEDERITSDSPIFPQTTRSQSIDIGEFP